MSNKSKKNKKSKNTKVRKRQERLNRTKEAWAELAAYDSSIWIGLIVAVIILIFE